MSEYYPQFETLSWVGVLAPAATSRNVIQRLNSEMIKTLVAPEVRERFLLQGYETAGSTPEQFAAWVRNQFAKWGKMIRERAITAQQALWLVARCPWFVVRDTLLVVRNR